MNQISFQCNHTPLFVPSEDGKVEDYGAEERRITLGFVKDFQNGLEASGLSRRPGTGWFGMHPSSARFEWGKSKERRLL